MKLSGFEYLDSLRPWDGKADFNLSTITTLMKGLGDPQDAIRSIHVAGTNGKGSVCAFLSAMIHSQGLRVGQMASPHLAHVTERCLINGAPANSNSFVEAIEAIRKTAQQQNIQPTYFEAVTAVTFLEFVRQRVSWMTLEVGLGGRLDATNVIRKPEVTVISSIDFDHTDILGKTLAEIAGEKAGILKRNVPVVVGRVGDEAAAVIAARAEELGCEISFYGRDFDVDTDLGLYRDAGQRIGFPPEETRSWPRYQFENAAVAVRAAGVLGLPQSAILSGLANARWPGRFERTVFQAGAVNIPCILDVAHNPQGVSALCDHLEVYMGDASSSSATRLIFVISILERKDWRRMLATLKEFHSRTKISCEWIFTTSGNPSAVDPGELLREFGRGKAIENPELVIAELTENPPRDACLVVTGSVVLVGRMRALIMGKELRTLAERTESKF